jgi:hypothetical protein
LGVATDWAQMASDGGCRKGVVFGEKNADGAWVGAWVGASCWRATCLSAFDERARLALVCGGDSPATCAQVFESNRSSLANFSCAVPGEGAILM